jgi:hypothetical protein
MGLRRGRRWFGRRGRRNRRRRRLSGRRRRLRRRRWRDGGRRRRRRRRWWRRRWRRGRRWWWRRRRRRRRRWWWWCSAGGRRRLTLGRDRRRRRPRFVIRDEECKRPADDDEERYGDQRRDPGWMPTRRRGRHHLRHRGCACHDGGRLALSEQPDERSSVGRALLGILRQRALSHPGEGGRSIWANGRQRGRRLLELAAKDLDCARRLEREPPRQHPVEDDSEGVDVRRGRHLLRLRLLRRHVRGSSHQRAGVRQRVRAGYTSDAEVGDLRAAFLVEDDVHRLQVAMNQASVVRMREPRGDFRSDPRALVVVERLPRPEPVFQRPPGKVLEDHVPLSVRPPVVEEPADVRMGERCDRLCLPLEALRVGVRPEHLDRDLAVELGVVRQPHLPHSARAQPPLETVSAADRLAHRQ